MARDHRITAVLLGLLVAVSGCQPAPDEDRVPPPAAETGNGSRADAAPTSGVSSGQPGYSMSRSGNALLLEDGEEIPILDEAVNGSVDHWTSDGITGVVSGWAANVDGSAPADAIVIVRNGEVATVSAPNLDRPDVAEYFEDDQLAASGFELQFPADDEMEVRVFGVKGDHASELPYADGFPW